MFNYLIIPFWLTVLFEFFVRNWKSFQDSFLFLNGAAVTQPNTEATGLIV